MPGQEIDIITKRFIEELKPLQIYLFGSYATGTETAGSDYDFYLVVSDDAGNIADLTADAYRAIHNDRSRPVDIIIGTKSRFESRKGRPSLENEVVEKGILLYAG